MKDSMRTRMNYATGGVTSPLYPEERLANAIVLQAVTDYRSALSALKQRSHVENSMRTKYECERFFESHAFSILSNLDGESLMFLVQDEINTSRKEDFNEKS